MIRCVLAAHRVQQHATLSPNATPSDCEKTYDTPYSRRIVEPGESRLPTAVPELLAALKHDDGNIRRLAASALGKIGDTRAVQPLLDLLAVESKPQVRQYAVKALGEIGSTMALPILTRIAQDENEKTYTRKSALEAIQRINSVMSDQSAIRPGTPISNDTNSITAFLSAPHARPLKGSWQIGFALDIHSAFHGATWQRSPLGELTYRLKYQEDLSVLPRLVEHTLTFFAAHPEMTAFDVIVPVPSSSSRLFNPVQEYSQALGRAMCKPVQSLLIKTRQNQPQKMMKTLAQKRANVAGVFTIQGEIADQRILLVDDLFDTGATLEEITQLLLRYGAKQVFVLTLTRTIHVDA